MLDPSKAKAFLDRGQVWLVKQDDDRASLPT